MEFKKEIKQIIKNSSLEEENRQIWHWFTESVSEREIEPILDLIKENPEMLNIVTENLKSKFNALKKKDRKAMDRIIEAEKRQLEEIG
jgi:Na+/phosphate symporter